MKTTFKELIDHPNFKQFVVNSKILDLGKHAEIIGNLARDSMDKDGKHAKLHCSNIVDWMQELAEQAQKILDLRLKGEKE
jgi:hypothetical protein